MRYDPRGPPGQTYVPISKLTAQTMQAGDNAELRKARGAFFTPPKLARYVAAWAVRSANDTVLEPSCGEASFLIAAGERLDELRRNAGLLLGSGRLVGSELHEASAAEAARLVAERGHDAEISVGDFLNRDAAPTFDACIGNPPYVRYQSFAGNARVRARAAALRAGVSLTGLASSWAAFVVHATQFLKPGGRLGLVLPAELLSVNYASEVRGFLMRRFGRVRLVLFEERVFPGVLEEVVLLLADGNGPTDHCELYQVRDVDALERHAGVSAKWKPRPAEAKWTAGLIPHEALVIYDDVTNRAGFGELQSWGETTLGMVSGNNHYFAMPVERVRELGLTEKDVIRLSPPGSRHLRGLSFTESAWKELAEAGSSVYLFRPSAEPSAAAERYIASGEAEGVDTAYKCRVRKPWWRVPLVPPADLFLTYMNADTPRLCANRAGVYHLNSVHGVYLRKHMRALGMDLLPVASLNTVTLLGAETVGRAYGGGILKLEPKEADRLPMPAPDLVQECARALRALRPQLATALRSGQLLDAVNMVDRVLLTNSSLGLKRKQIRAMEDAVASLAARRMSRGAEPNVAD